MKNKSENFQALDSKKIAEKSSVRHIVLCK